MVTELRILKADSNIFDTEAEYVIPLYQRAYAWEDKQIAQLIDDINDVKKKAKYYIGTLIVSKNDNEYEVVDGQQRLTTLFLLLNCLGLKTKTSLKFACRAKSNFTLHNIGNIIEGKRSNFDDEQIEENIQNGIEIILGELSRRIGDGTLDVEDFMEKLSRVVLYRIEVPENTDLNRYFEIMNTRGEQLEQHDILKAMLMSYLPTEKERTVFAKIWNACSDMTGYVQMHFNTQSREKIFGNEWRDFPSNSWKKYLSIAVDDYENGEQATIVEIISPDFEVMQDEIFDEDNNRVRFESVIEFPYFLMHVLKVYVRMNDIKHIDGKKNIVPDLLDDKKLIESYTHVIENGVAPDGRRIVDNKVAVVRTLAISLLQRRFLFDKYIIKREYANDNTDGEWSLKELRVSGQQSKKKAYYTNTRFIKSGQRDSTNRYRNKTNIMIQSALRVSYTSPKVMHWITELLYWMSESNGKHTKGEYLDSYSRQAEKIAQEAICVNFFDECRTEDGYDFAMGVNTPHIVFNYLDFLLWNSDRNEYKDFEFEFRNSVEHWYPQNPSGGTFEPWKDGVDQFGNLCIIQRNVNSKFSNMAPEAKKSTFREMISKGSLKLRCMRDLTENHGDKVASAYWKEIAYKEHEDKMIEILMDACGVEE